MRRLTMHAAAGLFVFAAALAATAGRAHAIDIERVVSPGGIEAWLVEEHSIPMIAVSFSFAGGSFNDPEGKSGLAYLLSATLDEGAGGYDSRAFRDALDDHAIELSYEAQRDQFGGTLKTLSENRAVAFDLLALSVNAPRFDIEPVGRMKNQIMVKIARESADPDDIAIDKWFETAFGTSGYGRRLEGTLEQAGTLTPDDLRDFHRRLFARGQLKIAVVGDITAAELGPLLDATFASLPEKSELEPIENVAFNDGPALVTVDIDLPQTELRFGTRGVERSHPDYIPAYMMNHILGGGGFSSRLYGEIRERRGLVYSAYSYLYSLRGAGLFIGGAGTRADRAAETLSAIRDEIARMAETGPSEEELDAAKKYLTGAYPLRFDSNTKIANLLVAIQIEDLGIDYVDRRNSLIEAVTIDDVRRAASALLDPGAMIIVAVGSKASIAAIENGG